MNDYKFESVWPEPAVELRDEVVQFWVNESAMSAGVGIERAQQLLVVARDSENRIAAVSTAIPMPVDSLGFECFYFRSFVGWKHRLRGLRPTGLIQQIIFRSFQTLDRRFQAGFDAHVMGLYFEVENKSLIRFRKELVWNDMGANIVFIGNLANGRQARVWYFSNARLP